MMSQPSQSPEDEFRQLLRGMRVTPSPEKTPGIESSPPDASQPNDLHGLLRETSSAPKAPPLSPSHGDKPDTASLKGLAHAAGDSEKVVHRDSPAPGGDEAAGIRHLQQSLDELRGRPLGGKAARTTSEHSQETIGNLSQALRENRPESLEPATNVQSASSRWTLSAGALAALALVAGAILWWPRTELTGHAGTLQDLAKAVEKHQQASGRLPAELAPLQGFPKGAVEWPSKFWNARDASGRTEIIWMPNGNKHYSIVLRQGAEVWIYRTKDGKTQQLPKR